MISYRTCYCQVCEQAAPPGVIATVSDSDSSLESGATASTVHWDSQAPRIATIFVLRSLRSEGLSARCANTSGVTAGQS